MVEAVIDPAFDSWQERARTLLAAGTPPDGILWIERGAQPVLPLALAGEAPPTAPASRARVPRRFVELGRLAACHQAGDRWSVLYRVLWRLVHERRDLLDDDLDDDVQRLRRLVQAVKADEHRMLAFVRFRQVGRGDEARLVAWYVPDHDIAALVAPHFAARYPKERWSILTPQAAVHFSGGVLEMGPGLPASSLPRDGGDEAAESLWRVYYGAVFNPARLNERKLRRDMPVKSRDLLPEARAIPGLVAEAPARVAQMRNGHGGVTQRAAVPDTLDLGELRRAASTCTSCPLHAHATQTVFGEGPRKAALMLIGEQPGDVEDRAGRPFVGPSGELLDRALAQAGIGREDVYVTNAVKHFGWEPRGKRRIHRTPRLSEIQACRPWLEHELAAVTPRVVVLLGGVAARALLGPQARVTALRGTVLSTPWAPAVVVTTHPSAVLRAGDADAQAKAFDLLAADLKVAAAAGK